MKIKQKSKLANNTVNSENCQIIEPQFTPRSRLKCILHVSKISSACELLHKKQIRLFQIDPFIIRPIATNALTTKNLVFEIWNTNPSS